MNEGIRSYMRDFINRLEDEHAGIKNNMLSTILKISKVLRDNLRFNRGRCMICNNECSNPKGICSVCIMRMSIDAYADNSARA